MERLFGGSVSFYLVKWYTKMREWGEKCTINCPRGLWMTPLLPSEPQKTVCTIHRVFGTLLMVFLYLWASYYGYMPC